MSEASSSPPATLLGGRGRGRRLTVRQLVTVQRLLDAAGDELAEVGYEGLTLRRVAERASVTHVTAYRYFSSKAHLVAAMFLHHLQGMADPALLPSDALPERVRKVLGPPGSFLAHHPALAKASLSAMLHDDPDVRVIRDRIGADLARRIALALGSDGSVETADALLLVLSGAMLQAGLGYSDFSAVVDRLVSAARQLQPNWLSDASPSDPGQPAPSPAPTGDKS